MTESRSQLVCVGTGASHRAEALRSVADQYGMASRVHFTGARSDLAAVYSAFDMLALSSSREGFPNVVAEAMACGVPAVVTNAGASPEIVGQLGEVSATHTAADFSAAMTRLSSRRSSRLSTACRARVLENYTLERCVQHTLQVMQAINPRRTR